MSSGHLLFSHLLAALFPGIGAFFTPGSIIVASAWRHAAANVGALARASASIRFVTATTDQWLALCIIHRSEKRLPYVAWRLWWEGYSVPTPSIRQFLEGARAHWQQGIEELRQLQEHPEQLLKLLDRTEVMRLSRKVL